MNNKNRLILERSIFTLFIIVSLGLIIMDEKGGKLFLPKIEKEINSYLEENYSSIKNGIKLNEIEYDNRKFKVKVESKKNKNLFFNITYNKGQITDTYETDYKEGKTLLSYTEETLQKEIQDKTNIICEVKTLSNLDEYTEKLQEVIIKEDNLLELKFYYIKKELIIKDWTSKEITNEIVNLIKKLKDNNITPKYYNITITKEDEITNSIEISNITEDFILNKDNEKIVDTILKDKNSTLLTDNKISYKYLN